MTGGATSNMICSCDTSRSETACDTLLYGTCTMLVRDSVLNISPDMCPIVPLPAEPKLSEPGRALARAISSFTEVAATDGWMTNMTGEESINETGAKSFSGSYGSFLYSAGLTASGPVNPIYS